MRGAVTLCFSHNLFSKTLAALQPLPARCLLSGQYACFLCPWSSPAETGLLTTGVSKYSTTFKSGNITRLLCTLDSGGHLILNMCYTKSRRGMPGEDMSSWCWCPEVFCRDDGGRRQLRAGRAASAWARGSTRLFRCRYAEKAEGSTLKCFFLREEGWQVCHPQH